MYIQTSFLESRAEELHRLIREYPLGTLVTKRAQDIDANHIPFLLDASSTGTKLYCHLPRANTIWNELNAREVLVIFHGPNAYISPSWYPSKQAHGKAVPTWNYAVVHAHGIARVIEDKTWLRNHLSEMTATHENHREHPWKIADAPTEYIDKLLDALVGVEIAITKLEGKFKLGQSRSREDRLGVIRALQDSHPALAEMTRAHSVD